MLPLYGRRKTHKLSQRRVTLMDELLPEIEMTSEMAANPTAVFSRSVEAIWLEIGFGDGEHLVHQARQYPSVGFIGAEPFINGQASLLARIHDDNLDNIRVYPGDAQTLLHALPTSVISRIFILYPDPWPKKRHHKRRFVNRSRLAELARISRHSAELLFVSDSEDYVDWTLRAARADREWQWLAQTADDWRLPPEGWPGTRYERKAQRAGRRPSYLRFRRDVTEPSPPV